MVSGEVEELPPGEAFEILGDELRLAILRELYDQTHIGGPAFGTVPYSTLQEAVGEEDSGRFSYHLNRLLGHFVEKQEDGYALRAAGVAVVRAVRSGTVTSQVAFGPEPVDATCFRCGSENVTVSYDEVFVTRCHDCAGGWDDWRYPEGTLTALTFRPAGLADRSPEDALAAVHARFQNHASLMAEGICPSCGAATEPVFRVCEDHEESLDELCAGCESAYPNRAEFRCENCDRGRIVVPAFARLDHPVVSEAVGAYDEPRRHWVAWGRLSEMETEARTDGDAIEFVYRPDDAPPFAVDDDLRVRQL